MLNSFHWLLPVSIHFADRSRLAVVEMKTCFWGCPVEGCNTVKWNRFSDSLFKMVLMGSTMTLEMRPLGSLFLLRAYKVWMISQSKLLLLNIFAPELLSVQKGEVKRSGKQRGSGRRHIFIIRVLQLRSARQLSTWSYYLVTCTVLVPFCSIGK